ncbi:hypothetical protein H7J51_00235 [Mycobacterium crocinum]|uniref:PepSY domain-containing protein n=1 Tax=Mycolicibacterium crocinum TaxID=388459 RepID=A0ABY3TNX8_9MYCO|nr:hypothetical protein [Mycolicibacterium crocinum]MCV7213712.1 hypothetical protein [Mycolicibacterium crocinum]ULN43162.1 hypothetical protein MI149_08890 [Mycolicibacterium crocinum]
MLAAPPATVYSSRSKADPASRIDTHNRARTDRVDQAGSVTLRVNGRLHHIGIGRHHYRTRVLIQDQDHHINVINAATGEVLRDFTLDPQGLPTHRSNQRPQTEKALNPK